MDFQGKKVLIIGAGKSGLAAADLLTSQNADIILYDDKKLDEAEVLKKLSKDFKGRIVSEVLTDEMAGNPDYLVLSPGVPIDSEKVLKYKAKGACVIGEVELAYYYTKGKIVAVTGTNGKTTTTALTGALMKLKYDNTLVGGNIGIPYTQICLDSTDDGVTVAEMSSFQLDTTVTFHPYISMILNITPDHLDRHHTMENYINAKLNCTKNQTADELCILNYEDETLRKAAENIKAKICWFSSKTALNDGMVYEDGVIYEVKNGVREKVIDVDEMMLIGRHNYENVMAAVAAARFMNVPMELIREGLRNFKPVEHRIEYVATVNGVKYYNDSKGTNPDASIQAVKAMSGPTFLIGGGYDKGSEYDEWIECFDGKIKKLILMGQTRDKIAECARKHGFNEIEFVNSMEEAVNYCYRNAVNGDTVLLSPCCASWGMFKNYEERGRIFKDLVNEKNRG
ncbi:MAG: UDP-N-acetylmuramoyl-L-alanine--D-glutamate ligase [Lachnospiraceae bacterium]|nr:UDP-N-acetylmuramoyl-L-alanine--D-glutamate ligase [Lachnospiraceae bacterium]MBR4143959.1 UDP-N-acetylmuramoyl-L-alanine--D-glutamate ligase [Lachnospiraceae bacterium]